MGYSADEVAPFSRFLKDAGPNFLASKWSTAKPYFRLKVANLFAIYKLKYNLEKGNNNTHSIPKR